MMKEVTLLTGQTLYDVAVQEYGHTDGIWLLLEDNPGIVSDLSSVPAPGTVVNIRLQVPELSADNQAIAAEFARRGQKVASGAPPTAATDEYVTTGYWVSGYSIIKNTA
jgi:hypothetical protein